MDNQQIIVEKELELETHYEDIKAKFVKNLVQNNFNDYLGKPETWNNDNKVFMFNDNKLFCKTEQILPQKHTDRIPVMLLFSNPHPVSVSHCLFLSEPHSRIFWKRLLDCKTAFPEQRNPDFVNYDSDKLKNPIEVRKLGKVMVSGNYESKFTLYFYCYWALPTKMAGDLEDIFKSCPALWNKICEKSQNRFKETLNKFEIKNVIVFADAPFKQITNVSDTSYKYQDWRFDIEEYLEKTEDSENKLIIKIQWPLKDNNQIQVYRSLITKDKNLKIGNTETRYFTELLDMIFQNILRKSVQNRERN
jgi:hypothetical protein